MKWYKTIVGRWKTTTPRFFRGIIWIGSVVSGTALAIQVALTAAGAIAPDWWQNVYPYLIGIPAGMAAVAKLTKETDNERKQETDTSH